MASVNVNELVNFVRNEIPKTIVDNFDEFESKFSEEVTIIKCVAGCKVPTLDRLYVGATKLWEELKGKHLLRSYLTLSLLHNFFPIQRNAETSQQLTKLMSGPSTKFSNRSEHFVQFLGLLRIKKSINDSKDQILIFLIESFKKNPQELDKLIHYLKTTDNAEIVEFFQTAQQDKVLQELQSADGLNEFSLQLADEPADESQAFLPAELSVVLPCLWSLVHHNGERIVRLIGRALCETFSVPLDWVLMTALSVESIEYSSVGKSHDHDNMTLFVGLTGAGKSTTVNYLLGSEYSLEVDFETMLPSLTATEQGKLPAAKTGAGSSVTTFPQMFIDEQARVFVDCPGYLDSRGVGAAAICAKLGVPLIVNEYTTSISVISLVVDFETIMGSAGRGLLLRNVANTLFQTINREEFAKFVNEQQVLLQEGEVNSVATAPIVFVVTKVPNQLKSATDQKIREAVHKRITSIFDEFQKSSVEAMETVSNELARIQEELVQLNDNTTEYHTQKTKYDMLYADLLLKLEEQTILTYMTTYGKDIFFIIRPEMSASSSATADQILHKKELIALIDTRRRHGTQSKQPTAGKDVYSIPKSFFSFNHTSSSFYVIAEEVSARWQELQRLVIQYHTEQNQLEHIAEELMMKEKQQAHMTSSLRQLLTGHEQETLHNYQQALQGNDSLKSKPMDPELARLIAEKIRDYEHERDRLSRQEEEETLRYQNFIAEIERIEGSEPIEYGSFYDYHFAFGGKKPLITPLCFATAKHFEFAPGKRIRIDRVEISTIVRNPRYLENGQLNPEYKQVVRKQIEAKKALQRTARIASARMVAPITSPDEDSNKKKKLFANTRALREAKRLEEQRLNMLEDKEHILFPGDESADLAPLQTHILLENVYEICLSTTVNYQRRLSSVDRSNSVLKASFAPALLLGLDATGGRTVSMIKEGIPPSAPLPTTYESLPAEKGGKTRTASTAEEDLVEQAKKRKALTKLAAQQESQRGRGMSEMSEEEVVSMPTTHEEDEKDFAALQVPTPPPTTVMKVSKARTPSKVMDMTSSKPENTISEEEEEGNMEDLNEDEKLRMMYRKEQKLRLKKEWCLAGNFMETAQIQIIDCSLRIGKFKMSYSRVKGSELLGIGIRPYCYPMDIPEYHEKLVQLVVQRTNGKRELQNIANKIRKMELLIEKEKLLLHQYHASTTSSTQGLSDNMQQSLRVELLYSILTQLGISLQEDAQMNAFFAQYFYELVPFQSFLGDDEKLYSMFIEYVHQNVHEDWVYYVYFQVPSTRPTIVSDMSSITTDTPTNSAPPSPATATATTPAPTPATPPAPPVMTEIPLSPADWEHFLLAAKACCARTGYSIHSIHTLLLSAKRSMQSPPLTIHKGNSSGSGNQHTGSMSRIADDMEKLRYEQALYHYLYAHLVAHLVYCQAPIFTTLQVLLRLFRVVSTSTRVSLVTGAKRGGEIPGVSGVLGVAGEEVEEEEEEGGVGEEEELIARHSVFKHLIAATAAMTIQQQQQLSPPQPRKDSSTVTTTKKGVVPTTTNSSAALSLTTSKWTVIQYISHLLQELCLREGSVLPPTTLPPLPQGQKEYVYLQGKYPEVTQWFVEECKRFHIHNPLAAWVMKMKKDLQALVCKRIYFRDRLLSLQRSSINF